jgi:anti-sigma B factor antagonist
MSLSLTTRHLGNVLVIDMAGKVTLYDDSLHQSVRRALSGGERRLVLNLRDVFYMDSAGLGQLVTVYTTVMTAGGKLRLLSPGPRVRHLLSITKLDTVFTILESESAIADSYSAA